MKKRLFVLLAVFFLAGCAQEEAAETVADVWEEPVLAQPKQIHLELPGETVACAMESDSGRIYLGDGYEVMVQTLPGGDLDATIRSLTQQLQEGRLTLKVDVEHLENMDRVFDGVFNRLSSAIVMASLVIGSSIVVHANPKPHWYGTSIMGVIGFLISGVLGAILLFNMLHRRN